MNSLRSGYTTGACAAGAAKAAVSLLAGLPVKDEVEIPLPDGGRVRLPIADVKTVSKDNVIATVLKYAGDDPDVTNGVMVTACVSWRDEEGISFSAGEGVGTITKKGLSVQPFQPAINPVPRRMISEAVREVSGKPLNITISIPGGEKIARKTFNSRLGITGGLSILGTTGRVRPFSCVALRQSLKCSLDVAVAEGITAPIFVPGNIGARAGCKLFNVRKEQLIEVGNEWGFMLDYAEQHDFSGLLAIGHPGKLAKLSAGMWDTHSSRSNSAVPIVAELARELLGRKIENSPTVEGIFISLLLSEREILAQELAERIRRAIQAKVKNRFEIAVALVNMKEELIGSYGDMSLWDKRAT